MKKIAIIGASYLQAPLIEKAKQLIKNTDKKGYDIAYECGFSDPHYFSYN